MSVLSRGERVVHTIASCSNPAYDHRASRSYPEHRRIEKTTTTMATRKKTQHAEKSAPVIAQPTDDTDTHETTPATFPVVGMGASAGGLAAFEAFFSGMPADTDPGMAFVLIQHLAPDHKSILTDLVRRYTRMKVFEVEDGMRVQPNCAYVIPPNYDMAFLNGTLQLLQPAAPRGQRLPIDFFFRSLAQDQHARAIGIVFSGTGSDGTRGVRAIKSEGGMVMAQTPGSTEFDSMPRSAINTGVVDYELPPAEMPAQLIAYAAQAFGTLPRLPNVPEPKTENALKKIFILLRAQTGHDFSQYKPSTMNRRIERRMAVQHIEVLENYVKFLQKTPVEVEALFRDLLIGVTNFFRDPEAFHALETQVIAKLFEGKTGGAAIRIWSTGCSTGEEAYSVAMLLQERMEALKQTFAIQLFATDIDSRAITVARTGLYPASIASDISPERLARFFTAEADGSAYRMNKVIRDMLVFSQQDLIKDPPFSKLDLICCRNLLIYLTPPLQKKLIRLFHYTLNPGGVLFLGTSETVGEFTDLFDTLDQKAKLYPRKPTFHSEQRTSMSRFLPLVTALDSIVPRALSRTGPTKIPLRELTEQTLLLQLALSGVLVNGHGDILYLHGRTGMYLEPSQGEAGGPNNILKMAREGLQRELAVALHKAGATKKPVHSPGLRVKTNGHFSRVNLVVRPVVANPADVPEWPLYVVILEEMYAAGADHRLNVSEPGTPPPDAEFDPTSAGATIAALNEQLRANKEYLQAANEELETSNEELKSSNEEMQSINEELQSTNEELETSKEEMQSVNEELATVNAELQNKVADLSRTSNDMLNLLSSTGIGTVFVDHQLRILRFTSTVTRIINLIPSDVGRPVAHTVSNLVGYTGLVADTQSVLDTLIPKAVDVQTIEGVWYTMRVLPYRTADNVIEGVVITFIDITEMVHIREDLRKANDLARLAVVVRDSHDAITVQDLDGHILAWNPAAERMYGWSETEALVMNISERLPPDLLEHELRIIAALTSNQTRAPYQTRRLARDGKVMEVSVTASALVNEAGQTYAIATSERAYAALPDATPEGTHDQHA